MKVKFEDIIVFEDERFLVVNKPPFMASLEDRNDPQNLQKLAKQFNEHLSACHRLDKETSGCLLFAKDEEAYRHASLQFEHRKVDKVYHAVGHGSHEFKNKVVDSPIYVASKGKGRINYKEGKPSKTTFSTIEIYKKQSLIECSPETGRMHQIRIHLAELDAPIVNDELYGGAKLFLSQIKRKYNLKRDSEEQPLIKRFALHAQSLTFDSFGEKISAISDYPKDFKVLVKQLKANKF